MTKFLQPIEKFIFNPELEGLEGDDPSLTWLQGGGGKIAIKYQRPNLIGCLC